MINTYKFQFSYLLTEYAQAFIYRIYSAINVQDGVRIKIKQNDSNKHYLRYGLYDFATILLFYLNTVFLKETFCKVNKFRREEKNIRNFQS